MIQQEQLMAYTRQVLANDPSGHGLDHIDRVVANAERLMQATPNVDAEIVRAAACLHDTYDDKLVANVAAAKAKTQQVLQDSGATMAQVKAIIAIIDHMSFKANLAVRRSLTLEGQIVQDADRLDALGAIGIARAMLYGGAHGSKLYDPTMPPRMALNATSYREDSTVINHFYEKLLHLTATMNTAAGKRLAQTRTQVMKDYLAEFKAEWQGER